jgi:hypothetical protein
MRSKLVFRPSILPVVLLCVGFAFTARADLLTTTDAENIEGQFLGFAEGSFRFQSGEQTTLYPSGEVKSLALSPSQDSLILENMLRNITQTLTTIQNRIDQLQYQMNGIAAAQDAQMRQVQQRVFELNPMSRLVVEQQRGEFSRSGAFRVTGFLRNDAGITVHQPLVKVDLLLADGAVIDSRTAPANVSAIGARQRAGFRVEFPKPPRFDSFLVTPVLDYAADPGAGTGTYPPLRMEPRD